MRAIYVDSSSWSKLLKEESESTARTLDAIHVAHCLHIAADLMVSYDDRQIEAAESADIRTVSPGRRQYPPNGQRRSQW